MRPSILLASLAAVPLAGCASADPNPLSADRRYQALIEAHRIAPSEELAPAEVLAVYDFVQLADGERYAGCAQFSIVRAEDGYMVLALNGYGPCSGWILELNEGSEGLRLAEALFSPCFYID